MQFLALTIDSVASNYRINILPVGFVKFIAELTKVVVGNAYVMQFADDEFDDDHIVEITYDRNVVGQDIFRIGKVNKGREQSFPINLRQMPFVVSQHADE